MALPYPQQINNSIHNNHWNTNGFLNPSPIPQTYMFQPSPQLGDASVPSMYFPSSDLELTCSPNLNVPSSNDLFPFQYNAAQFIQYPEAQMQHNTLDVPFNAKEFQQAYMQTPPMSSFSTFSPNLYDQQLLTPESDQSSALNPQNKRDRITLNEKRKRVVIGTLFDQLNDTLPPLKTSRYTRYRSLIHASLYIKRLQSNIAQLNQLSNHLETHHNLYNLPLPANMQKTTLPVNIADTNIFQAQQPALPFGY
jgi:hypothetical protein